MKPKNLEKQLEIVEKKIGSACEYKGELRYIRDYFEGFEYSVTEARKKLKLATTLCEKHNIQIPQKYVKTIIEI